MSFDAVVFPGQGAQKANMAHDFYESHPKAKAIFELADNILSFNATELCFNDDERLHQTAFTQPCIVTAELAIYEALCEMQSLSPSYFAGHSLGEYTALATAGVFSYELALKLVEKRGELMQNTDVDGGMAAIIMPSIPLSRLESLLEGVHVDIANDNSLSQVVLSGDNQDLTTLLPTIEQNFTDEGVRVVPLNVSAPFHSRFMREIEQTFREFLATFRADFNPEKLSQVQSNFLGRFYQNDVDELIDALANQLSGRVRWRDNMAGLLQKTNNIIEIGPQRPLKGFFKTLDVDIACVCNIKQINRAFA